MGSFDKNQSIDRFFVTYIFVLCVFIHPISESYLIIPVLHPKLVVLASYQCGSGSSNMYVTS